MASPSRRSFLQAIVAAALGGTTLPTGSGFLSSSETVPAPNEDPSLDLEPGTVVLFQGDSITDADRDRNVTESNVAQGLGLGYAFLAASRLLRSHPGKKLDCYNRGVSGDKVFQLADRWKEDCLSLQPDVLSILVGVNDFWHTFDGYEGTVDVYERDFRALLDRTRNALPDASLIIGEPFALTAGSAVDERWFPAFRDYQRAARRIADDYGASFIPYQSVFDEASKLVVPTYWSDDGVHPSTAGSALMAEAWLRTFRKMNE